MCLLAPIQTPSATPLCFLSEYNVSGRGQPDGGTKGDFREVPWRAGVVRGQQGEELPGASAGHLDWGRGHKREQHYQTHTCSEGYSSRDPLSTHSSPLTRSLINSSSWKWGGATGGVGEEVGSGHPPVHNAQPVRGLCAGRRVTFQQHAPDSSQHRARPTHRTDWKFLLSIKPVSNT